MREFTTEAAGKPLRSAKRRADLDTPDGTSLTEALRWANATGALTALPDLQEVGRLVNG